MPPIMDIGQWVIGVSLPFHGIRGKFGKPASVIGAGMVKGLVLAVDDEEDILELICYNLHREGYDVMTAVSGEQALKEVRSRVPDLIVLDLMLPGMDGLEVCRRLKNGRETAPIPIIMVTAKAEEADVVTGLEMGADDYVIKPFSPRVLTARVKAVLRRRRTAAEADETLHYGHLLIQPQQHLVRVEKAEIELTATEYRILHLMARRPGWVFSRDQIVDSVKGSDSAVTSRSVDVHLVSLRRKLGNYGHCVETVRGVGYRFREPDDA